MDDRQAFKRDLTTVLRPGVPAAELDAVVAKHFPSVSAFRENDDLVVVEGETRRLFIRRVGPDRFVTSARGRQRIDECPRRRRRD